MNAGFSLPLGLLLGAFAVANAAEPNSPTIANADFESASGAAPAAWSWWSRTEQGSAERAADEKHGGSSSACLRHDGPRDWALSSDTKLPARPGQHFRVSAWVKVRRGAVTVAVVGLGKGKPVAWDVGSGAAGADDQWVLLDAPVTVLPNCDAVYVRFVGEGEVLAWVDDVALRPWSPPPPVPKPKVQGYAFGARRVGEALGRGLIARPAEGGRVYLGWRLLEDDPRDVAFHVYRQAGDDAPVRLTSQPVRRTTDFTDAQAPAGKGCAYTVRAVAAGAEGPPCQPAHAPDANAPACLSIPLEGADGLQKVAIADLDGDGRYDYVIKRPDGNIDPYEKYWKKSPDTYKLEAYRHDGTFLWRIDLGWSIERGIWYSPYLAYDLDGDGRAEVIAKTGEGDPRDAEGRVRTGPEYVSVFDGLTGRLLTQADWPSRDQFTGPKAYNHASRNQIAVAYLDGKTPCLIVERGTYEVIVVDAYEFHGGKLRKLWQWTNRLEPRTYWGQGAHWMHAADVDGDGRDEVILGSAVLDDDGTALWSTGLGHPDHCYVGDLDPLRPGLEIYYGLEKALKQNGMCMVDASSGKLLWGLGSPTRHVHNQGLCSDIDPRHPGSECYSADTDAQKKFAFALLHNCRGEEIGRENLGGFGAPVVWWDADPQRELVLGRQIRKYQGAALPPAIEGRVVAVADVLGDWREEILVSAPGELRIYTTTIPAADRRACLMQDAIYRADVAHASMGYYQCPVLSYDLATGKPPAGGTAGAGRSAPPVGEAAPQQRPR